MDIKYLVIHCSDSPAANDNSAENIHQWHKERGWDGIGYHFVIRQTGNLENGRPIYWEGAHVRGNNHESIGICLIGNVYFSDEQKATLRTLINELLRKYPAAEVVGHRDLDPNKTCPNFDVKEWLKNG